MADIPQVAPVRGGVVPYLMIDGVMKALELYKAAFGAEVAALIPPDAKGRTMHAHIHLNGGSIMFSDPFPEQGAVYVPAGGFSLMLLTDQIDADYKRAVDAGCTATMPPADMFWGDRYGQLKDPFGLTWAMNQGAKRA